jgi:hypothetical protein
MRVICPAHHILDLINRIILGEECRSYSLSLFRLPHSPVMSSLLGPNIFHSTLFSNTLSLCSFLRMRYQVSHPYKTTGKITVLYTFNLYFWIANWKTKGSELKANKHYLPCSILQTSKFKNLQNMRNKCRKQRQRMLMLHRLPRVLRRNALLSIKLILINAKPFLKLQHF